MVRHVLGSSFFAYGFDLIDHTILIQELGVGDVTKKKMENMKTKLQKCSEFSSDKLNLQKI